MPIKYDRKDRNCSAAKTWRKNVIERDKRCVTCNKETSLVAHHIVEWNKDENLRFDISNGEVLCRSCHMKLHKNKKGKKTGVSWNRGMTCLKIGTPKGTKFSEDHKKKLSDAKKGKEPPNKGKPMKESTKKIFSEMFKGRKWKFDIFSGKRIWYDP